jgi:hypothetical protein
VVALAVARRLSRIPSTGSRGVAPRHPGRGDTLPVHPVLRAAAERRFGVFTAAEAVAAGHRHSEIQNLTGSGRWVRLRRGVLITADDLERARGNGLAHRVDCVAVLLALDRPRTAVSHLSAAQLWGVPVPRSAAGPIRLTDPDRWRRGEGYVMSRAPPGGRGLAIRSPAPDVGATDARRLRSGVATGRRRRRHGRRVARRPDDDRSVAGCGEGDPALAGCIRRSSGGRRLRIVGSGLPLPELQVEIRTGGRLVGVVDAWFEEAAVAVEFDGRVKYTDPWRGRSPERVLWEEKRREDELRSLDIRVLRIADVDLGMSWGDIERRLGFLLATPGPATRRFSAVARAVGMRRTG